MGQRQHAADAAAALGIEEVGGDAGTPPHDLLPAGTVEEGGLRAGDDKASQRARSQRQLLSVSGDAASPSDCSVTHASGAARGRPGPCGPSEVAQQAVQAVFHAVDIDVVAKPRLGADAGDARLLGVDFPGMEIEDRRLADPPD